MAVETYKEGTQTFGFPAFPLIASINMSSPIFAFSPFAVNYTLSSSSSSSSVSFDTSPLQQDSKLSSTGLDPFSLERYETPSFMHNSYLKDLDFTRRGSEASIASTSSSSSTFSDCSTIVAPSSSLPLTTTQSPMASSYSSDLMEEYYSPPSNALGMSGVEDWRSFGKDFDATKNFKPSV